MRRVIKGQVIMPMNDSVTGKTIARPGDLFDEGDPVIEGQPRNVVQYVVSEEQDDGTSVVYVAAGSVAGPSTQGVTSSTGEQAPSVASAPAKQVASAPAPPLEPEPTVVPPTPAPTPPPSAPAKPGPSIPTQKDKA